MTSSQSTARLEQLYGARLDALPPADVDMLAEYLFKADGVALAENCPLLRRLALLQAIADDNTNQETTR